MSGPRRVTHWLSRAFVKLRVVIILAWAAGVAWSVIALPTVHGTSSGTLADLLPPGSPAVRAEQISSSRFAFPLLSRTIIVVANPRGLSPERQVSLVDLAARLSSDQVPGFHQVAGALPLLDTRGYARAGTRPGTTELLYLFFRPSTASATRTQIASRLLRSQVGHRPGEFEGVTGEAPARAAEDNLINDHLGWVELATGILVALAVGLFLRAVGAAVLALTAVVAGYLVADGVVALIAHAAGMSIPSQARPLMVVLVFGITTDYTVFFLTRCRRLLCEGVERQAAAAQVVREISPIVVTAGLTVAAGTGALLVARLGFIRGFGPALAVTVLVAMFVAVTLVPAALAIGGRWWFWPGWTARQTDVEPALGPGPESPSPRRGWSVVRLAARHPIMAMLVAVVVIAAAGSGLRLTAIGNEIVSGLPSGSAVRHAYQVAERGLPPGLLAPTVVVATGPGIGSQVSALQRLQVMLRQQPGAAEVIGPRRPPPGAGRGVWRTANAARFVMLLRVRPLGSRAIADVGDLRRRLPRLARRAGLASAHMAVAGDTAVSADIARGTLTDLMRVTPTMLGAIFVVMAIFLRALVAPVYLVLTSALAAAAALGLTTYVMQDLVGYGQITYYVVFTVSVLLISLGSDYNIFLVGRIWQAGRRLRLREAVAVGGTRAARPIAMAAVILSLSFALIAIVPIRAFREIAFAMAAGLLIDAFVVRAILVPGLMALVGARSAWPGRLLGSRAGAEAGLAPPGSGSADGP